MKFFVFVLTYFNVIGHFANIMVIITTIEMKYNAHGRHIINNLKTNMELLNHNFITTGGANSALFL